jgi:predicted enzyme related to lactoylglutathione lyase
MVRGIKFVGIPVRDQDLALKLTIPGAETGLALFTPEGHEDRIGQFQSMSFWCDDVFATAKILKGKGVTFAQEPKNETWGSSAIFADPDGNRFVLSSKGKPK